MINTWYFILSVIFLSHGLHNVTFNIFHKERFYCMNFSHELSVALFSSAGYKKLPVIRGNPMPMDPFLIMVTFLIMVMELCFLIFKIKKKRKRN